MYSNVLKCTPYVKYKSFDEKKITLLLNKKRIYRNAINTFADLIYGLVMFQFKCISSKGVFLNTEYMKYDLIGKKWANGLEKTLLLLNRLFLVLR